MRIYQIVILALLVSCSSTSNGALNDSDELLGLEKATAFKGLLHSFDDFIESNYSKDKETKDKYKHFLLDFEDLMYEERGDQMLDPKTKWTIDVATIVEVIAEMESTRMRHEIMLFPHESFTPSMEQRESRIRAELHVDAIEYEGDILEDEITPFRSSPDTMTIEERELLWAREDSIFKAVQDSSMFFNSQGLYLHSLLVSHPTDTFVEEYVQLRKTSENISPAIFTEGYKRALDKGYDIEALRTLISVDLYYQLVYLVSKQERKKTTR